MFWVGEMGACGPKLARKNNKKLRATPNQRIKKRETGFSRRKVLSNCKKKSFKKQKNEGDKNIRKNTSIFSTPKH